MNKYALAIVLCAMTVAHAQAADGGDQGPPPDGMRGPPPASMDRVAMNNAFAEELARRTGRKPSEVVALLQKNPPPRVAEQLGLSPDEGRAAADAAEKSVMQKAVSAQLITAEQAGAIEKERSQRRPQR